MYSSFENNEFSANAKHILVEKILKSTMTQHKKEYEILSLCLRYTFVFVNENVSVRDFFSYIPKLHATKSVCCCIVTFLTKC